MQNVYNLPNEKCLFSSGTTHSVRNKVDQYQIHQSSLSLIELIYDSLERTRIQMGRINHSVSFILCAFSWKNIAFVSEKCFFQNILFEKNSLFFAHEMGYVLDRWCTLRNKASRRIKKGSHDNYSKHEHSFEFQGQKNVKVKVSQKVGTSIESCPIVQLSKRVQPTFLSSW